MRSRFAITEACLQLSAARQRRVINLAISYGPQQTPTCPSDARPQQAGKSLRACGSNNLCHRSRSAHLQRTLEGAGSANLPKHRSALRRGECARFAPCFQEHAPAISIATLLRTVSVIPCLLAKPVSTTANGYCQLRGA